MREIILDIETTGLEHKEGHRVIEIGCIELNSKEVGASYHQYINPSITLSFAILGLDSFSSSKFRKPMSKEAL